MRGRGTLFRALSALVQGGLRRQGPFFWPGSRGLRGCRGSHGSRSSCGFLRSRFLAFGSWQGFTGFLWFMGFIGVLTVRFRSLGALELRDRPGALLWILL